MKLTRSIQLLSAALLGVCAASFVNAQTLIAGWDFQTTTSGGTAAAANPGAPLAYTANFGSGTLYLNGTSGSSAWTSAASNPEVTSFGGSSVNTADTDFSTVTSGTASLVLANSSANGKSIVFSVSMANYESLAISYSTQRTATGFTSHVWSYSSDGVSWIDFDTLTWPGGSGTATTFGSVGVVALDTLTALNGVATAYIRLTVDGATATAGNNRLDNIQFVATAVPEPSSAAVLAGLGALGFCALRRRRSA